MGKGVHKACDELVVQVEMATATISAGNWSVEARGGRTYVIHSWPPRCEANGVRGEGKGS